MGFTVVNDLPEDSEEAVLAPEPRLLDPGPPWPTFPPPLPACCAFATVSRLPTPTPQHGGPFSKASQTGLNTGTPDACRQSRSTLGQALVCCSLNPTPAPLHCPCPTQAPILLSHLGAPFFLPLPLAFLKSRHQTAARVLLSKYLTFLLKIL